MIKLRSIINESFKLNFAGEFSPEEKQMAKRGLLYSLENDWSYLTNSKENALNRFEFTLKKVRDHWSETIFSFEYNERGGRNILMKPYPEASRQEIHKFHRNIESAIKEIPKDPNSVYRGMSFGEALNIKKTGYVNSNSSLTLGPSQEGYTFFGENPSTGVFYAGGFQPVPLTSTRNKPGVIIQISQDHVEPAELTINPKTKHPIGSRGEWVSNKPIKSEYIQNVWFIINLHTSRGTFEVIYDKHKQKFSAGSRSPTSSRYVLINKPNFFKI